MGSSPDGLPTPIDRFQQVLQIDLHLQNAYPGSNVAAPTDAASVAAFCSTTTAQLHSQGVLGLPHPNRCGPHRRHPMRVRHLLLPCSASSSVLEPSPSPPSPLRWRSIPASSTPAQTSGPGDADLPSSTHDGVTAYSRPRTTTRPSPATVTRPLFPSTSPEQRHVGDGEAVASIRSAEARGEVARRQRRACGRRRRADPDSPPAARPPSLAEDDDERR
jgi:hypothetical protein